MCKIRNNIGYFFRKLIYSDDTEDILLNSRFFSKNVGGNLNSQNIFLIFMVMAKQNVVFLKSFERA